MSNPEWDSLVAEAEAAVQDDERRLLGVVRANDKAFNWDRSTPEPEENEHRLLPYVTTMSANRIRQEPEPREVIAGYFPVQATTAVVAMGGVGKTTWLVRKALELDPDLEVMIVSAEDGEDDYHAKIYNTVFSDYSDIELEAIDGHIHVMNLKGKGAKLVVDALGSFVPSGLVHEIINTLDKNFPRVRLVIFETVSRFAGGEDNERMEALVTACDAIAIAIQGAVAVVHHMGKSQGREKVIDLYSGRGGSALGDNTRSMIVLTRLDDEYMGEQPVVVNPKDIEAGRVFEVSHVRNSYGVTMLPEYYITRPGICHGPVLEPVRIATEEDQLQHKLDAIERKYNTAATLVHKTIRAKGGTVKRKFFDHETKKLIGLTQAEGRDLINQMLDAGSLIEFEEQRGRAKPKFLKIGAVNHAHD